MADEAIHSSLSVDGVDNAARLHAAIFTGWISDHLLPHPRQVKLAHPLMLRAIAAAKKKNDRIDADKIACAATSCWNPKWHPSRFATLSVPPQLANRSYGYATVVTKPDNSHDGIGADSKTAGWHRKPNKIRGEATRRRVRTLATCLPFP